MDDNVITIAPAETTFASKMDTLEQKIKDVYRPLLSE